MSHPMWYTTSMKNKKSNLILDPSNKLMAGLKNMKDNKDEFKKDLHEWLAEMKARQEINRKRDEEQARWDAQFNAPLNLKDRD